MVKNFSQIVVKFQKEGIHKYPAALTDPKLEDVKFLGQEHRHVFHFEVGIQVWEADREIEFIQFKRWLEALYSQDNGILNLNYQSCEMMSDALAEKIEDKYPNRIISISIFEDNENGAVTIYTPKEF